MTIDELKKEYELTYGCGDNISEILKFKKLLLSDNSPDVYDFHYELIRKRKNTKLYLHLRAALMDRPEIEKFLLVKIKSEQDDKMIADILQILGTIQSPQAVKIARNFVNHDSEYDREVSLFVLGWTGEKEDIALLRKHLLEEKSSSLQITAASAHRQIALRKPELKMEIIESLKHCFSTELNDDVTAWIIIMISTIMETKLGIREDKQQPDVWHGDLEKAKIKTKVFLDSLLLKE